MSKLSFFKKSAIAVSLVAGMAAVGTANAGSLAQSVLTLNNFKFLIGGTSTPLSTGAFVPGSLNISDSYQITSTLNGVTTASGGATTGGAPLGQNTICTPSSCPAFLASGSPFTSISSPTVATGNGAMASTNLTGYPISGLAPGPVGATAQTAALSEVNSTGSAGSQSGLTLTTDFTFTLVQAQGITIDFDTIAHLYTNLQPVGSSSASLSWSVTLVNNLTGLTVFSWSPDGVVGTGITGGTEQADGCNLGVTRTRNAAAYDCSGHETATTGVLAASTSYTLSLGHQSISSVSAVVPEPETLSLLGLGLAGLALVSRRRVRKA